MARLENLKIPKAAVVQQSFLGGLRTTSILIVFLFLAVLISFILYSFTQRLLKERLQERLIAIAATGATQFDAEELVNIHTLDDSDPYLLERTVQKLQKIKNANKNIRYSYLMRRSDDPEVLEFIADAESLRSDEELDTNENGAVEDTEIAPLPGDPFEIAEYPVLLNEAFYQPAVDQNLEEDQWSIQMSAYAPIFDASGDSVAIYGIDVIVDDFRQLTQATLLPFLLFVLFLILSLTLMTLLVARLWKERVEIVEELDRQKDELLSIVSHQLATPVTSIRWQLEMLLTGDIGEITKEQKEHIETTHRVTANLVDLIGMILDVSRIQLGKMQVTKAELDVNEFFKELIAVIEPRAIEKKVKFIKNIQANIPKGMLDKRLTNMTLENLLSNAVKYTPTGGEVEFKVELKGNRLYCTVRDTGMGIPEKEQAQIFGKLFRASNARNQVDGNGFGLYVAKGAVEGQGGSIRFESKEGKGTTFYVELPLK